MLTAAALVESRSIVPGDADLIRLLFAESREDLGLLPPQHRESVIDMQLRAQDLRYQIGYPHARHEILVVDGVDVGRMITDRGTRAVHLIDLVVRKNHRRRGIATQALRRLLAEAAWASLPVSLSVWSTNTAARKMYERLDFTVAGDAVGHLEMNCAPSARKECV